MSAIHPTSGARTRGSRPGASDRGARDVGDDPDSRPAKKGAAGSFLNPDKARAASHDLTAVNVCGWRNLKRDNFSPQKRACHASSIDQSPTRHDAAKKRRLRRRRMIIFSCAGAALFLIVGLIVAGKREKPIPVTTEKAARRTILQTVSATGKVRPKPK